MGIIARFRDIMAANINALLDRAEDPEKMIDQLMRNLASDLAEVKEETAAVIAEEKRTEREMNECSKEIAELTSYAMKAVQAGNDGDARKFLHGYNGSRSRVGDRNRKDTVRPGLQDRRRK